MGQVIDIKRCSGGRHHFARYAEITNAGDTYILNVAAFPEIAAAAPLFKAEGSAERLRRGLSPGSPIASVHEAMFGEDWTEDYISNFVFPIEKLM